MRWASSFHPSPGKQMRMHQQSRQIRVSDSLARPWVKVCRRPEGHVVALQPKCRRSTKDSSMAFTALPDYQTIGQELVACRLRSALYVIERRTEVDATRLARERVPLPVLVM